MVDINSERILRAPEVLEKVGFGRSTLYELIKRGEFPRQIALGRRMSGWLESEIDAWIEKKREERGA